MTSISTQTDTRSGNFRRCDDQPSSEHFDVPQWATDRRSCSAWRDEICLTGRKFLLRSDDLLIPKTVTLLRLPDRLQRELLPFKAVIYQGAFSVESLGLLSLPQAPAAGWPRKRWINHVPTGHSKMMKVPAASHIAMGRVKNTSGSPSDLIMEVTKFSSIMVPSTTPKIAALAREILHAASLRAP